MCRRPEFTIFIALYTHQIWFFFSHFGQLWWNTRVLEKNIPFCHSSGVRANLLMPLGPADLWRVSGLDLWPVRRKNLADSIAVSWTHAHWRGNELCRVLQRQCQNVGEVSIIHSQTQELFECRQFSNLISSWLLPTHKGNESLELGVSGLFLCSF